MAGTPDQFRDDRYARKNINAMKNYYLLLQIDHLLSQLVEKLKRFSDPFQVAGRTFKSLVEN
ncbi:MAG: hypothetical protein AAF600_07535 [Bacteroidota bacterium]